MGARAPSPATAGAEEPPGWRCTFQRPRGPALGLPHLPAGIQGCLTPTLLQGGTAGAEVTGLGPAESPVSALPTYKEKKGFPGPHRGRANLPPPSSLLFPPLPCRLATPGSI